MSANLVGLSTPDGHRFVAFRRVNSSGGSVYEICMPWGVVQVWVVNEALEKRIVDWIDGGPRPVGYLGIQEEPPARNLAAEMFTSGQITG